MRRTWPAFVLLVGALVLLASLYLPWEAASCGGGVSPDALSGGAGPTAGLPSLFNGFGCQQTVSGWSPYAALFTLLLAIVAAWSIHAGRSRLVVGQCALLAGYFGLADATEARSVGHQEANVLHVGFHFAYGAYLGTAAALVLILLAGATPLGAVVSFRPPVRLLAVLGVAGLVAAVLLPWKQLASEGVAYTGIVSPPAVAAAALALLLPLLWWKDDSGVHAERVAVSVAVLLLIGAGVSSATWPLARAYGAWVSLGIAAALAALALVANGPVVALTFRPPKYTLPVGAALLLFVTALYLPWQRACYHGSEFKAAGFAGCHSANGWSYTTAPIAALLAFALAVSVLWRRRIAIASVELALGLGLLVGTIGLQLVDGKISGAQLDFGYGSTIGFVGAALLIFVGVLHARSPAVVWRRVTERAPSLLACVGYLAIVVLPWWDVLPSNVSYNDLRIGPLSWLTIGGALLAIHLLFAWLGDSDRNAVELVVLPLLMLALASLDLIELRAGGITWGGGAVVGICLLLALLGRVEQRGGIRNVKIPDVLRVDRI